MQIAPTLAGVPAGPFVKRGEQSWELKFVGEFLGVASEMYTTDAYQLEYSNRASIQYARANLRLELADSIVNPVSYTHLTLPTIYSV